MNKALKKLLELLESKQKNRTIITLNEEYAFINGGLLVLHELTKHKNKDKNNLECMPPKYFVCMMRGESINGFKYKK